MVRETDRERETGKKRVRREREGQRERENSLVKHASSTHLEELEKNRLREKNNKKY